MVYIFNDGRVAYNKPLESTIQCNLDMSAYPFDEQVCTYVIYPLSTVIHDFKFIQNETGIFLPYFERNEEWEIVSTSKAFNLDVSISEWPVRTARLSITLKRSPDYVIIHIFVPIFILSILNLTTFLLPVHSGEKMGTTLSIFLTFSVFVTLISDSMPKSSENLSYFGIYVAGQLIISGMTIVMEAIVIKLYLVEDKSPFETENDDSHGKYLTMCQELKQCNPDRWKRTALQLERCFCGFTVLATISTASYLILGLLVMR
jgi:hypothetical protein